MHMLRSCLNQGCLVCTRIVWGWREQSWCSEIKPCRGNPRIKKRPILLRSEPAVPSNCPHCENPGRHLGGLDGRVRRSRRHLVALRVELEVVDQGLHRSLAKREKRPHCKNGYCGVFEECKQFLLVP